MHEPLGDQESPLIGYVPSHLIDRPPSHWREPPARTSQVKALPPEVVSVGPARRGFPLTSVTLPHVSRLRSGHEAREQKRNKPWPTGPHQTNQTHRYRAQDATARAQWHRSALWSPVRDEEAAGSNPVTPTGIPAGHP
jgi:hypothetical protein